MRNRIIAAAIEEINATGLKFTMADLAGRLAISKSTLYAHFKSKEELIMALIDSIIDDVRCQNEEILNNDMLNIPQKMEALFVVRPQMAFSGGGNFLHALKRQFPQAWEKSRQYYDDKAKLIESLLVRGIASSDFRPVDLTIAKIIFTASINEFLNPNFLMQHNFTFKEAVEKMADILYLGIKNSPNGKENKGFSPEGE